MDDRRLKAVRRVHRGAPRVSLVLTGIGLLALVTVMAVGGVVDAGLGCDACHAMRPYVEAHESGVHARQPCSSCHASRSLVTLPAQGLRGLGWLTSNVLGRSPSATEPGDTACRECHAEGIAGTVESSRVSVRHQDFVGQECGYCHSGAAHQVEGRYYRLVEMDDCMVCHKGAPDNPDSCAQCHTGSAERSMGSTAWRATHGEGWEQTHGMGDQSSCIACHQPTYCVRCHGVRMPHPGDWPASHGEAAVDEDVRSACITCHEAEWCSSCHGLEMPHPHGFLPGHGLVADEVGDEICTTCHPVASCDVCHYASAHPDLPGVTTGHRW